MYLSVWYINKFYPILFCLSNLPFSWHEVFQKRGIIWQQGVQKGPTQSQHLFNCSIPYLSSSTERARSAAAHCEVATAERNGHEFLPLSAAQHLIANPPLLYLSKTSNFKLTSKGTAHSTQDRKSSAVVTESNITFYVTWLNNMLNTRQQILRCVTFSPYEANLLSLYSQYSWLVCVKQNNKNKNHMLQACMWQQSSRRR